MRKTIIAIIIALCLIPNAVFAEEFDFPDEYVPAPSFLDNFEIYLSDGTQVTLMQKEETEYADEDEEIPIVYLTKAIKKNEVLKLKVVGDGCGFIADEYYIDGEPAEVEAEDGYYILPLPEENITMQYSVPGMIIGQSRTITVQLNVIYVDEVEQIINDIAGLPEDITLNDKDVVSSIRAAYASLSEDDKAKVTNYDKLVAAEAKVADLEKAAEFDEAVGTLPDLDNLSDADYEKIAVIKEKYDTLTDEQKKLVSNEAALKLAFEKLTVKRLQDELDNAKKALNEALENETPESDINKLVEDVKQTKEDLKDAKDKLEAAEATLKVKSTVIKKVKAKAQKKKTTVTWKSAGSGYKYEIYKSLKVSGGYKRAATSSKAKVVIKKLKSKKTYYVKVRGFKTVNGKKVYTQYSDVVSVKIK